MIKAIDVTSYKFSAIIFDCDNTLAKTAPVHYIAFSTAVKNCGYSMEEAWYYERVGISGIDLLKDFQKTYNAAFDIDKASLESGILFKKNIKLVRAVEPVAQVAHDYYKKLPMAVASGGNRPTVEATLEAINIAPLFKTVVTVEDVTKGKPAPDLFLLAAQKLSIAPQDCLVFEDSDEGIEAAQAASMQVIDVRKVLGPDYLK
ncbi:HAD-IA family hydrolase [Aristophania vespae]|uniref:HAD-IA family hydrolase n=1 Tax=Aristophania vespae TaxID=2697033 RepID=A0A6P1NEG5_9PROT|nr:HAD family phosphatase [Aristophania vespae]QHI95267.1 HAD-IA family hydrolase [Aristophania vespae]UMM64517.1 Fructose-1-phosphate phosphatase YqaB [Aristophania vespae]